MKTILIALAAVVIIGGGYYWYSQTEVMEEAQIENESVDENIEESSGTHGKLNIDEVCEGALAYMTFPDGESAEQFVAECKAGEHPEVIERYKAEMKLGDGAAI